MSWVCDASLACRFSIGAVFATSAFAKVRTRAAWQSFRTWLAAMPLRPARLKEAPAMLVTAEAVVVVLVAAQSAAVAGLAAAAALSLALAAGLYLAVRRGSRQPCHCFGSSAEPLSGQHVARNLVLLGLALTGLACTLAGGVRTSGAAEAMVSAIGGLSAALGVVFFVDIASLVRPGGRGGMSAPQAGVR